MNENRLYVCRLMFSVLPEMRAYGLKRRLLKWAGVEIGEGVKICSSARISGGGRLIIGDGVWVGSETLIRASPDSTVAIGKNVDIAPRVLIWTGTHPVMHDGERAAGPGMSKNITIKDGSWIAASSTIAPGVTIGCCSVVAAGAVVTKDVPDYVLVAGCPATIKKRLR